MMLLFCAVPLIWAAVTDYKKRIIPDWTWIVILLIGIISAIFLPTSSLYERIVGFLLPGFCLLFLAMEYGGVGGGDIKLTAAMGFTFELNILAVILLFALLPACIYARVTKQQSVPLAVFLCTGAFCCGTLVFILSIIT